MGNQGEDLRTKRINKAISDNTFEYCAICWAKISRKDTPVELRNHYVSGVGQLCPTCYLDLHREMES